MGNASKGGHKAYGRKMADPRLARSKEHRGCGSLGRYNAYKNWLAGTGGKPTALPKFMLVCWR